MTKQMADLMKIIHLFNWHCIVDKHTLQKHWLQILFPTGCVGDSLGGKYVWEDIV